MNYIENVKNKLETEKNLRYEENNPTLYYKKFDKDELKILLVGDEHIGNAQHNRKKLMVNLEWAYNNKIHILHMGDGVESATRSSVGAGVYEQEDILDKQMSDWIAIYEPFVKEGLFLGAHVGNHEARVFKDDGVNIMRHMCRQINGKYLGVAKNIAFRVGNETYLLYTTHGASGARMPHTKIKGVLDLERIVDDVEIYAMGHLHQLSHHVRECYGINLRKKIIERKKKHFILTGAYLKYWNSYAHVKSMEPARQGSPLVTLDGNKHSINVSLQ